MATRPLSIAFIVRDPLPPQRADLLTLFGIEMPRHGIHTELVGQGGDARGAPWRAGGMHVVGSLRSRFASVLAPLWDALGLLRAARRVRPDCIQVRDKIASALLAWLAARMLRVPFVYWMSFPIVEGYEARRDALARRGSGGKRARWHALWLAHALRARAAVRAEVGLSPIPRGALFDVSLPTKLVEYLALGIPGVANDIPDQALVIEASGAGLCVPMQADAFADATLRLLGDPVLATACAKRGPPWVRAHRTYDILARDVALAYSRILPALPSVPPPLPSAPPCGPGA